MKKRSSIHLLGLTMLYMVGTMGIFSSYYTLHHRTTVQSRVKSAGESALEVVILTEAEYQNIQWIDKETEFEWKGKLYDVASITRANGNVTIQCENDSLEEMLLSLVNPDKEKAGGKLFKGSLQPMTFLTAGIELSPSWYELPAGQTTSFRWAPILSIPGTDTPPPKA